MLEPTGQKDGVGAGVAAAVIADLSAVTAGDSFVADEGAFSACADSSGGAMRMRSAGAEIDASITPLAGDAAFASTAGSRSKRGSFSTGFDFTFTSAAEGALAGAPLFDSFTARGACAASVSAASSE